MVFTAPYVILSGSFVVRSDSAFTLNAEVDREGVRVVVGMGSAYDLYLSKTLKRASLVRMPTSAEVVPTMIQGGL